MVWVRVTGDFFRNSVNTTPPKKNLIRNRLGVAKVILQTLLSPIHYFKIKSSFVKISLKHHHSQTVRDREITF